jgi:CDGSH iron-sulfur domain-containing protein 3
MSNVVIRIRDNGPLLVEILEGSVQLVDAEGNPLPLDPAKKVFSLCRCGASNRKPFCDGTHKTCGFDSAVRATTE